MTAGAVAVLTGEEIARIVKDAYVTGAREAMKIASATPATLQRRVLSASDVRTTYHIGKETLRRLRESGELPAQSRPGQGGRPKFVYLADDCLRVLGTTHLRFPIDS